MSLSGKGTFSIAASFDIVWDLNVLIVLQSLSLVSCPRKNPSFKVLKLINWLVHRLCEIKFEGFLTSKDASAKVE